jgi:hypothetical protein
VTDDVPLTATEGALLGDSCTLLTGVDDWLSGTACDELVCDGDALTVCTLDGVTCGVAVTDSEVAWSTRWLERSCWANLTRERATIAIGTARSEAST